MPATTPLKNWIASSMEIYTKLIKQGDEYECFVRYVLLPALFMASLLLFVLAPLALGRVTAYSSILGWFIFGYFGLRHWQKHHLGMEVDCRLTDERMIEATESWIREVKPKNEN